MRVSNSRKSSPPSKRAAGKPPCAPRTRSGAATPCGWSRSLPAGDWSTQRSTLPPLGGKPASARSQAISPLTLAGDVSALLVKPTTVVALGRRSARNARAFTVVVAESVSGPE